MFKQITTGGLVLATVLAGSVIGGTTAHADQAVTRETYVDQFTLPQPLLSALCGFEIWFTVDARKQLRYFEDASIQAQDHGTSTIFNPANGRTLTRFWAGQFRGEGTETLNDDGTLTVTFSETYNGVHERWMSSDGGVLVMDRGQAAFTGEVLIDLGDPDDPDDDEVLHFHQSYELDGPHPILEGGGLDPALACDYLA